MSGAGWVGSDFLQQPFASGLLLSGASFSLLGGSGCFCLLFGIAVIGLADGRPYAWVQI